MDGSLADAVRSLRYQVTLDLMAARPDLLWLHAASAAREGRAVLIPGRGGSGKSTLVTRLAARGFSYLGDDVIPVDLETAMAVPFPVSPSVRRDPGGTLPAAAVRVLPKTQIALDSTQISRSPVPVGLVVLPAYERGSVRAWPSSPAHTALRLLRHCLNHSQSRTYAIPAVCALVAAWPALVLRFDDADRAADLIASAHADATVRCAATG